MANLSMADLLANQQKSSLTIFRGQEIEGQVISLSQTEVVLDLGTKAEGVLPKKDLSPDQLANLKVGDKLLAIVIHPENDSGQVVLGFHRPLSNSSPNNQKFSKFEQAKATNQVLTGTGLEVNKGGLIVEVGSIRGFLPSSQVTLSQAANLEELVGKEIQITVIEVDPSQNRLIFSQKTQVSTDTQKKLNQLKLGQTVSGQIAAVLPFGIFVSLPEDIEGLVHISELSWDKIDDPNLDFKLGDTIEAKVISTDNNTGRVNLSIKQLSDDPFVHKIKDLAPDDVVKVTVSKMTSSGVQVLLTNGLEGLIPTPSLDPDQPYQEGQTITCLIDSIDSPKRRINLAPFITSTKDLIYK